MTTLVLVLAPTAYGTRAAQAAEYRTGADVIQRRGVAAYLARTNAEPVPAILAKFADDYHAPPEVVEAWLPVVLRGAAASDLPAPEAVRAVTAAALLLAWDADPGHPVSTSEQLAALLPHAELHVAQRLREVGTWTDRSLPGIEYRVTTPDGHKKMSGPDIAITRLPFDQDPGSYRRSVVMGEPC